MCPIHYESPHEITDQPMPLLNLDKDTSDKLQFSIPECEGGQTARECHHQQKHIANRLVLPTSPSSHPPLLSQWSGHQAPNRDFCLITQKYQLQFTD